jgi:hypothetical protein
MRRLKKALFHNAHSSTRGGKRSGNKSTDHVLNAGGAITMNDLDRAGTGADSIGGNLGIGRIPPAPSAGYQPFAA